MRPRLLLALLAAPSLAVLLACSVKAPPRAAWSLSSGRPDAEPQLDPAGPALGVTRFTAAAETRTTTVTWRDSGGHRIHETGDRWVDYPDRMLEEMAMARLLRSGRFQSVTAAPPREGLDAVLSCRLAEFGEWDENDAMEARVVIRWDVTSPDGALLGAGEADGRSPVAARTTQAVIEAHAAAADAAIEDLVAKVAEAARKVPPT